MQLIPNSLFAPTLCASNRVLLGPGGRTHRSTVNLHLQGHFDTRYTLMTQDLEIRRMLVSILIPESALLHEAAHGLRMGKCGDNHGRM